MSILLHKQTFSRDVEVFAQAPLFHDTIMVNKWQVVALRLLDVTLASALLIIVLPVMLIIAVLIKIFDNGPVFFAHERVGMGARLFSCLKFRSMVVDSGTRLDELLARCPASRAAWERDRKLPRDPRVTRLGNFLRKSSLDELPQLINVLRGDMSLVGPRPIVVAETYRYGRYINVYYQVRPGITGLWQISGRNNVTYRRRVAMDVVYTRGVSIELYLRILVGTAPAVLSARGSC